ncbi:MAG: DNA recombination protein RmuC [Geobacteraceae bacterium]
MNQALLYILIFLALSNISLLLFLLARTYKTDRAADAGGRFDAMERAQERFERSLREEIARNREESATADKEARQEIANSFRSFTDAVLRRLAESAEGEKRQLDIFSGQLKTLTDHNIQKLDKINETVEKKLASIQEDNNLKLEQMRATVDEKLHDTLEKRLGESFKIVSDRLELVHKGLGEMQSLATGVGDLKKVLTNVKTRGVLGEIQLGSLLEQILTPEQYASNVVTKPGSNLRVEFAIRLPGRDEANEHVVWLPIDAKFPQEDYLRLVEAQELGALPQVEEASRQLERAIKEMARNIRDKYLAPPHTTDFGIMFLPTEGLYAEVLRRTGLFEQLQREFKVVITGPTTLAALLNSLQMGFRTLSIEKRSSEVWTLLGAVKTEFSTFGAILDKTKKKLQEASNSIESAATRSRAIERKLRNVQNLPDTEAAGLLGEGVEQPADDEIDIHI